MCVDNIVPENIDFCPTDESVGGTSEVDIWWCEHKDFDVIAEPPALDVAVSYAEAATISDPHTFTAPNGFKKLAILPDTGQVESPHQGEKGAKSVANAFMATIPGVSPRNVGWLRRHKNVGMIFLVRERNGNLRQIGGKTNPAYIEEATPASGLKAEDINGIPVKISDVQAYAAPFYTGAITEFTPA